MRLESIGSNVAEGCPRVCGRARQHHAGTCLCASAVRTTGNWRSVACAPSAWGLRGARAGQLEAQSVEGVHHSVVGGRPDPRRHPDHLPPALSPDQDVVPDSSAQPNPLDTFRRGRGRRRELQGGSAHDEAAKTAAERRHAASFGEK